MKRSERTRHKEMTDAWKRLQEAKTVAAQAEWFLAACTAYPPRSDRNSRHQVVQCSRCGEDVLVPYCGPVPRLPIIHKDHSCTVTAIPYVYDDALDPATQRWVLVWVSVA